MRELYAHQLDHSAIYVQPFGGEFFPIVVIMTGMDSGRFVIGSIPCTEPTDNNLSQTRAGVDRFRINLALRTVSK